jgi:hypothetical protein
MEQLETTTQVLVDNNQFNLDNGIMTVVYVITILMSMIILLISLIQFTSWLLNFWAPWYKFYYKKPTALLIIWVFLVPVVFVIETLIKLFM